MKQQKRMWFGVVTAMILLLVIIDRYDLHRVIMRFQVSLQAPNLVKPLLSTIRRQRRNDSICDGAFGVFTEKCYWGW